MTKKSERLIKDWGMDRVEERIPVTSRLDFEIYAKLHALKSAFPKRSVNEIINDVLSSGLDEIIESLGDPVGETQEFIDELGFSADVKANKAYVFDSAFRKIMADGKTNPADKKEKNKILESDKGESL